MRALDRIRSLAAVMTLLLFITTSALANVPRKPIDRPEGPPEPNPTEVGDPDSPPGLFPVVIGGHLFMFKLPKGTMQLLMRYRPLQESPARKWRHVSGERHAR